ncbi:class I adenylate-forming enzyme family protein [Streptomyces sp. NPDC048560]|uniref:class I adenylate-forming enzyme family protein n=1 Tax=Streptomyces sp. NPDC048560 TaxID=3155488 RepID=UPI00341F8762
MTSHTAPPTGAQDLSDYLALSCDKYTDRLALSDSQGRLSYGQLHAAVEEAAQLIHKGAGGDDGPVIVLMDNSVDSLVRLFAIWRSGRCAVPLDASVPAPVVISAADRTRAAAVSLGDIEQTRSDLGELGEVLPGGLRVLPAQHGERDPLLFGAALVIFTSGSTGIPKGVVLGHTGILAKLAMVQEALAYQPGDHALAVLRTSFLFCQWDILLALGTGGSVRLLGKFTPKGLCEALAEEPVSRVAVVPTMLRQILPLLEDEGVRDPLVRTRSPQQVVVGGELLPPQTGGRYRALLPHSGLSVIYGLTETSAPDFILPAADYDAHPDTVGRALTGVRWYVDAPGQAAAVGDSGVLAVSSAGVLRGYLGQPELTSASVEDGFFRTGDQVEVREGGRITVQGRGTAVVVKGANKIAPAEVEAVLEQHPQVVDAFSCGVPDPSLGERLYAVVAPAPGHEPTPEELLRWMSQRVERYKVPDVLYIRESLPIGSTGKIDRAKLSDWVLRHPRTLS